MDRIPNQVVEAFQVEPGLCELDGRNQLKSYQVNPPPGRTENNGSLAPSQCEERHRLVLEMEEGM